MDATLEIDGLTFRDLDHDGVLAPYEDWRLSPAQRARDLLDRLTLAEKAGLMMHGTVPATGGSLGPLGIGSEYDLEAAGRLIHGRGLSHFITRLSLSPGRLAEQNNCLQRLAARGRLGIPLTISTDPRHHARATTGAGVVSKSFSQWPDPMGLAAAGDVELVRRFGEVVRRDYRAVGIHMALSPQADLATHAQWPRTNGGFGQDPHRVAELVKAYIEGVQGGAEGVQSTGVAAVVKHWVGYGAARDGFDGHNHYGRFSSFPAGRFEDHLVPFRAAFEAGVAGVMPTYNILEGLELDGQLVEPVGAGFNQQLLTDLLRGRFQYRGVILSDWWIIRDCAEPGLTGVPTQGPDDIGMPWGVESLSPVERCARAVNAGLDQFGGEDDPRLLLQAVEGGLVSETLLDLSAYRTLMLKFELGLFDAPYVDAALADGVVGSTVSSRLARQATLQSLTTLKSPGPGPLIPPGAKVHLHGIDASAAPNGMIVCATAEEADIAVVRLAAPFETLHAGFFFGRRQHEGRLDFRDGDPSYEAFKSISAHVPTIAVIYLDRAAVLTPLAKRALAIVADFGASDALVMEALAAPMQPQGRLPIALPRSMAQVTAQASDRPVFDPLFEVLHSDAH